MIKNIIYYTNRLNKSLQNNATIYTYKLLADRYG